MGVEVQFGGQGLVRHPDAFGLSPVDRGDLSEAFKWGSGMLRFALRGEMLAAMQRKCRSRKGQLGSCGDISGSWV